MPPPVYAHKELHQFLSQQDYFSGHISLKQNATTLIQASYKSSLPFDAPIELGPITQSFMGALCHQLERQQILTLEEPFGTYLPATTYRFPHLATCTLKHLLTHTSGCIDFVDDPQYFSEDLLHYPHTTASLFPALCKRPSLFPPGQAYHYSRLGYILLTHILQTLTHQSLSQLMQQYVLHPLELKETHTAKALTHLSWDPSVIVGWGHMTSTIGNLEKWLDAIFLHQFAYYETIETQIFKDQKNAVHTGLGWHQLSLHGHSCYTNTPPSLGTPATVLYFPKINMRLIMAAAPYIQKPPLRSLIKDLLDRL